MMMPKTEAELAEAISASTRPVKVTGGGTRNFGRFVEGEILSVAGMTGVVDYEPGALTLVVRSGTPVAVIEKLLSREGQRLAFEPMDHRGLLGTSGTPTIGGVCAANVSGPRRVQAGAARDAMLGLRFVDGTGRVLRNGGRVMKNVTGYDLVKLLAGSHGTLGVMTEVSLKLQSMPEVERTLIIDGLSPELAVSAMSAALGTPYEVSGAAYENGRVYLRVEGFEASVAHRISGLQTAVARFGESYVVDEESAALWLAIRDVEALQQSPNVWKVSVPPSRLRDVLDAIPEGIDYRMMMDWGGGLCWIGVANGATELHHVLQGAANGIGHATLIKAPEALRRDVPSFQPVSSAVAMLTRGIRAKFDPKCILNPGLLD